MKRRRGNGFLLSWMTILFLFFSGIVYAAPAKISYQGSLTDSDNKPYSGTVKMTFVIYDAKEGGNDLWAETLDNVTIKNGLLNLILGKQTDLTSDIVEGQRYYGITINDGNEMTPRC